MQQPYAASVDIYAGFWRRFVAYLIDSLVIGIPAGVLGGIVGGLARVSSSTSAATGAPAVSGASIVIDLLAFVAAWLYWALLESSSYQATLGKMAMGIQVTDLNGQRLTFGRASGRYFGKIISALICYIGFIMAAFTQRKQALHDMMAGTLVVRKAPQMAGYYSQQPSYYQPSAGGYTPPPGSYPPPPPPSEPPSEPPPPPPPPQ